MILTALAISVAFISPQDTKPVALSRVFVKGEKLQYAFKSNLHSEDRVYGSQTFLPNDQDLNYKFTTEVKALKADGVAVLHYQRPVVENILGENFTRPSVTLVEKWDWNLDLTVSPINEILDQKDLNPPKKKPAKTGGGDGDGGLRTIFAANSAGKQNPLQELVSQFVDEARRLAMNLGNLDSSLDFSPKLPFEEVKIGDTWKKTISYQPQKLKGKDGKQAVQRLDYTFTYKGVITVNGKQFRRVNAALDLKTDLGDFINQIFGAKPDDTHIKSIPLVLKQSIDYDLDMATNRTVLAKSKAEGGVKLNITDVPDEPYQEEKLTGTTEMRLVGISVVKAAPAVKHGGQARH
jgi:hypothetical protein